MAKSHICRRDNKSYKWSMGRAPAVAIESGQIVTFDCIDASDGMVSRRTSSMATNAFDFDRADPIFGPVFVNRAEPGDVLEVEIMKLEHGDWAWTGIIHGFGLLSDDFDAVTSDRHIIKTYDLQEGSRVLPFNKDISVPIRPFLGTIGVAQKAPGEQSTIVPTDAGGNIDCRHVTEGSTLLLPVQVPGALFSCGDGHCAQGDGEVCGVAAETEMKATLRFTLVKNQRSITSPHLRNPPAPVSILADCGTYSTMGVDTDLNRANQKAVRAMITHLVEDYHLTREDAYILCSMAVDLRTAEVVDGNQVAMAMLPLNIFNRNHEGN